jgi:hypothetical protein
LIDWHTYDLGVHIGGEIKFSAAPSKWTVHPRCEIRKARDELWYTRNLRPTVSNGDAQDFGQAVVVGGHRLVLARRHTARG